MNFIWNFLNGIEKTSGDIVFLSDQDDEWNPENIFNEFGMDSDVYPSNMEEALKIVNNNQKTPITGVPTGFADLDYKTAGLHNSDLVLVAARPAMGKSAFALNIATAVASGIIRSGQKPFISGLASHK